MVRWICNVKVKDRVPSTELKDRVPSTELRERLGIYDIILILQQNRLRWYGHVLRKEDFWRLLRPVFAASREQHISDLHSKFALGSRHVSKYGRQATCGR